MIAILNAHKIDSELISIAEEISPNTAVLCDEKDGSILPGLTGANVYSGQWALTPSYSQKNVELKNAGMELEEGANQQVFNQLLASHSFDSIVVQKSVPANTFIQNASGFNLIECYVNRCLYRRSAD